MYNKATLIGNVGQDPEIKTMNNGGKVANLSLATSDSWKDKSTGERKEKTEWHKIVVFNEGLINVVENYIKKGSKLFIEGQIETRKYQDKDGQDRYTTEIVLKAYNGTIKMLDGKSGGDNAQGQTAHNESKANGYQAQVQDNIEDEIPF